MVDEIKKKLLSGENMPRYHCCCHIDLDELEIEDILDSLTFIENQANKVVYMIEKGRKWEDIYSYLQDIECQSNYLLIYWKKVYKNKK